MDRIVDHIVDPGLFWLADWSLRWAILLTPLALGLALPWARRIPAAVRWRVCLVALTAGLALPFAPRWGAGFWHHATNGTAVATQNQDAIVSQAQPVHDARETAAIGAHAVSTTPADAAQTGGLRPSIAGTVKNAVPSASHDDSAISQQPGANEAFSPPWQGAAGGVANASVSPAPGISSFLSLILAGVYILGVLFLALRWVAGCIYLNRLRRSATPIQNQTELVTSCAIALGMKRRVLLLAHSAVNSPIALGPRRPAILVPLDWSALPADLQRSSLTHELAHLARRDDWLALVLRSVRIAFFFHPVVLWLTRRLERESEILCDEAGLATGVGTREYASMLLDYASRGNRLAVAALPFGGKTVKSRINHILEGSMHSKPSRRRTVFGVITVLSILAISLGAGSLRLQALADEPKPNDGKNVEIKEKPNAPDGKLEIIELPQFKSRVEVIPIGDQGLAFIAVENGPSEPKPKDGKNAELKEKKNATGEQPGAIDFQPSKSTIAKSIEGKEQSSALWLKLNGPAAFSEGAIAHFVIDVKNTGNEPITNLKVLVEFGDSLEHECKARPVDLLRKKLAPGDTLNLPLDLKVLRKRPSLIQVTATADGDLVAKDEFRLKAAHFALVKTGDPRTGEEPQPRRNKDDLTYDGKHFDQWKQSLLTELNPKRRAEAINALAAFGANGYGAEAVKPILDIARAEADKGALSTEVYESAQAAMGRLGTVAVPELTKDLKLPNGSRRLMAVNYLGHMGRNAVSAAPELLKVLEDKEPEIQGSALTALSQIQPNGEEYVAAYVRAAGNVTEESDPPARHRAFLALETLAKLGPDARSAAPGLVKLLDAAVAMSDRDANSVSQILINVIARTLTKIGGQPEIVVPAMVKVVEDQTAIRQNPNTLGDVFKVLAHYGTKAKPAVPAVVHFVSGRNLRGEREGYVLPSEFEALLKMGAEPKTLVPLVRNTIEFRKQSLNRGQLTRFQEFLNKYGDNEPSPIGGTVPNSNPLPKNGVR